MHQIIFPFLMLLPMTAGDTWPGSFFWRPKLGLDLLIPTEDALSGTHVQEPNINNIREGVVVLVNGYQGGITVISLAAGLSSGFGMQPHLNPISAYFYNDAYRWLLRYLSLIPFWIGNNKDNFCDTTRVWRRRFFYMDEVIPKWLRYIFPYVKQEDWDQEEKDNRRFKKFSLSAFGNQTASERQGKSEAKPSCNMTSCMALSIICLLFNCPCGKALTPAQFFKILTIFTRNNRLRKDFSYFLKW